MGDNAARTRTAGETFARLAATLPVARRLWLSPTAYEYRRVQRILKSLDTAVFAVRESRTEGISSAASVYTLRDSGLRVALRHGGSDPWVLEEIFDRRCYELPQTVRTRLAHLGRPPRVLDLGGHIGLFGLYVLGLFPDAEIISVEPDPSNRRLLESCIRLNGLDRGWTVVPACAGVADGTANFVSCEPSYGDFSRSHAAREAGPGQLKVPVRDVLPLMEEMDLVKLDVQGGEWEILQDPRLAVLRPSTVVLEYHPYLCPVEDPLSCVTQLLGEAGYVIGPRIDSVEGEGILWAWSDADDA